MTLQQKTNSYKKNYFCPSYKDANFITKGIEEVTKMRRIKGYKSMSKEKLLSALDESECNSIESTGRRNSFNNARITKIRKDFNKLRDRLLKPKIKEIRRNIFKIENKKNLSKSKIKEIEQNLIELEKSF